MWEPWTSDQLDTMLVSLDRITSLHESPIEYQFGVAASAMFARVGLLLHPQYIRLSFRYDFAVVRRDEKVFALIECDGAAFHATDAQIENDRRKDQAAREVGVVMLRYSGSEIFNNPQECALNAFWRTLRGWGIA